MEEQTNPQAAQSTNRGRWKRWLWILGILLVGTLVTLSWLHSATQSWVARATAIMSFDNDYESALPLLDRAIMLAPSEKVRSEAYASRAVCHASLGNWSAAAEDKTDALEHGPTEERFFNLFRRGLYWLRAGESEKAVSDFVGVIEMSQTLNAQAANAVADYIARSHYYVGLAAYRAGNQVEAQERFDRALQIDSRLADWPYDMVVRDGIDLGSIGASEPASENIQ